MTLTETESESSAPAIGAEAGRSMKRTPRYTDEKLGRVEVVEDFLPPPERLQPVRELWKG